MASSQWRWENAMECLVERFSKVIASYPNGAPVPEPMHRPDSSFVHSFAHAVDPELTGVFTPLFEFSSHVTSPVERVASYESFLVGHLSPRQFASAKVRPQREMQQATLTLKGSTFFPLTPFLSPSLRGVESTQGVCRLHTNDPDPAKEYVWRNCEILHFLPESDLYEVLADDGTRRHVSRLALRNPTETVEDHARTMAVAQAERALYEQALRFDLFLGLMEDDVRDRPLPASVLNRIVLRANVRRRVIPGTRTAASVGALVPATQKGVAEHVARLRDEYAATMKRIRFAYCVSNPANARLLEALDLHFSQDFRMEGCHRQPRRRSEEALKRMQQCAQSIQKGFRWKAPTQKCFQRLRAVWFEKYARMLLCDVDAASDQPFVAFVAANENAREAARKKLRLQYCSDCDSIMVDELHPTFSYSFLDAESFHSSPLGGFFRLLRCEMSIRLREMGLRTLGTLAEYFRLGVGEPALFNTASDRFFTHVGFRRQRPALVELSLKQSEEGSVVLSPSLPEVRKTLLEFLLSVVQVVGTVDTVETIVMSAIHLPKTFVPALEADSPEVEGVKAVVTAAVDRLAPFVTELLAAYDALTPRDLKDVRDFFAVPADKDGKPLKPKKLAEHITNKTYELDAQLAHNKTMIDKIRFCSPDTLYWARSSCSARH